MRAGFSDRDTIRGLAMGVIGLFCALVCMGFFFPAYVDDVLWLMPNARAGYDDWRSISFYPKCMAGYAVPIPLTLLPGRALAWGVQMLIDDFYTFRLISTTILAAWIAYTAWFIRTCFLPSQPPALILAGVIGYAALGTLPFIFILGRPETAMIFAVTFFASLPYLVQDTPAPSRKRLAGVALLFLLTASWFVAIHPKAFLYVPLLLVSAGSLCRWNKPVGGALLAFVLIASLQTWFDYLPYRTSCPGSREISQILENNALLPSSGLLRNPSLLWHRLVVNFFNSAYYLRQVTLPDGRWWLPDIESTAFRSPLMLLMDTLLWNITQAFFVIVTMCALLWAAGGTMAATFTLSLRRFWTQHDVLVPLCLLAAFVAQCAFISEKVFYNFTLIWITLGLCAVTAAPRLLGRFGLREKPMLLTRYRNLLLFAIVSQSALLVNFIPATVLLFTTPAPNGRIEGRFTAISEQHYADTRRHILGAAAACHIAPDRTSRHVVVDPWTYLALKETYQPFRVAFHFHDFDDTSGFLNFLQAQGSAGLVTLCTTLPDNIKSLTTDHEGVCCLSRDQITAH